jgi:replication factor C subunit 3/5
MKNYQSELFVYKYRPTTLDQIDRVETSRFKQILQDDGVLPNLIIYGHENTGKSTMLHAFLNDQYGDLNTMCEMRDFKINSKKLRIPIFFSRFHIEIDINSLFSHARSILPTILKTFVQTKNVFTKQYKICVIHHVENLEAQTQHILRRILELYINNCRFVFTTSKLNKITQPLQSRCELIALPHFTEPQIHTILTNINRQLDAPVTSKKLSEISSQSSPNIKKAIFQLESEYYNIDVDIYYTKQLKEPLLEIMNHDTTKNITNIDDNIYVRMDLFLYTCMYKNIQLENVLNATFETLRELLKDDYESLNTIMERAVHYDLNMNTGSRDYIHIQAFFYFLINFLPQRTH